MQRHELGDQEWDLLAPLIPSAATGRPRTDDWQVIIGMVHEIRTGMPWRSCPLQGHRRSGRVTACQNGRLSRPATTAGTDTNISSVAQANSRVASMAPRSVHTRISAT
ncbi:transposase [Streptomyces wedmorensis]|uniref:transposase n=1 Tax=Streptomyces wedmorensis TaxID=43759 RepID=UPI00344AF0B3